MVVQIDRAVAGGQFERSIAPLTYPWRERMLRRRPELPAAGRRVWAANGRNRRVSLVSARPGEGPLPEPITGVRPARQELVFMPLLGHCPAQAQTVRSGGKVRPSISD